MTELEKLEQELLSRMVNEPEVYAQEEDICTIDPETRTITIPVSRRILGVESDESVERLYFRCPKIVGDNIDLSTLSLRINYQNAGRDKDQYVVTDMKVDGGNILFSWEIRRKVAKYKGNISFIVCAVRASAGVIKNEWNTALNTDCEVLEGLEVDQTGIQEETKDVVEQLLEIMNTSAEEAVQKVTTEGEKQIEAVQEASQEVAADREQIGKNKADIAELFRIKAPAIICEAFGESIVVEDSSENYFNGLNVYGKSEQVQTNGFQLFDASKLPTKSAGGATVTNNGDGSVTVSGSGNLSENYSNPLDLKEILKCLKVGKITFKCGAKTNPTFRVRFAGANGDVFVLMNNNINDSSHDITQEELNKITNISLLVYGQSGEQIIPGTIKPMLYQDGDGTWEPFTGGKPSPSPEYPQEIESVGDGGWFDGESDIGYWTESEIGKPLNIMKDPAYRRFKNPIACIENDVVEFNISNPNQYIYLFALDENECFIKYFRETSATGKNQITATMPTGTKYCIGYYGGNKPPFKESYITVLINGKYAVKVKTTGKNIFDFENALKEQKNAYEKISNDEFEVKNIGNFYSNPFRILDEDRTVTLSGTVKSIGSGSSWMLELMNMKNEVVCTTSTSIKSGRGSKIRMNYSTAGQGGLFKDIQVEIGAEQTPFQSYKESTALIQLDAPLYEGDYIYLEDGELWEYRENERVVYDGSEDEMFLSYNVPNSLNQFYTESLKQNLYDGEINVKCDKLRAIKIGDRNNNYNTIYLGTGNVICFNMSESIIRPQDINGLKEWLKQNPLEVVYKLATPTRKRLDIESEETIKALKTYYPITHISNSGGAEMVVEYIVDTRLYIDGKFKELQETVVNTQMQMLKGV